MQVLKISRVARGNSHRDGLLRGGRAREPRSRARAALQVDRALQHDARRADGDDQPVDRADLPAYIFHGIGLTPLKPGNTSYLLWMFMGFMVVTAVLVVWFGRLGDMFGRVRMYNMGFAIFAIASTIFLTVTWMHGSAAALWLIIWR